MPVTVKYGGKRLDTVTLVSSGVMREIGNMGLEEITLRTERGVDQDGYRFNAYSPAYARRKARYRGIGTGRVDLRGIGPGIRMLDAVAITSLERRKVVLGFTVADKALLAYYHCVSGAGKRRVIRDFFGLGSAFLGKAVGRISAAWRTTA